MIKRSIAKHIFFIFFVNFCFSQNQPDVVGKVIYQKFIDIDIEELEKDPKQCNIYNSTKTLIENLKKIDYSLTFNKQESIFKLNPIESSKQNTDIEIASVVGGGNGTFYISNKDNKVITQKNAFGQEFLVIDDLDNINWKIGDDIKLVGKYACLKAVATVKVHTRKGVENQKIFAWFNPTIKFNTGPIGYGGLPGLILELQKGKFIYRYKSISFNKPSEKIIEPTKGKKVTSAELLEISQKMLSISEVKK